MITIKCKCGQIHTVRNTKEAAEYLELSLDGLKYHIYRDNIGFCRLGHDLAFTDAQLAWFLLMRRPPKEQSS